MRWPSCAVRTVAAFPSASRLFCSRHLGSRLPFGALHLVHHASSPQFALLLLVPGHSKDLDSCGSVLDSHCDSLAAWLVVILCPSLSSWPLPRRLWIARAASRPQESDLQVVVVVVVILQH